MTWEVSIPCLAGADGGLVGWGGMEKGVNGGKGGRGEKTYKLRPHSNKQLHPNLGPQLGLPARLDKLNRALDMRTPGEVTELLGRDVLSTCQPPFPLSPFSNLPEQNPKQNSPQTCPTTTPPPAPHHSSTSPDPSAPPASSSTPGYTQQTPCPPPPSRPCPSPQSPPAPLPSHSHHHSHSHPPPLTHQPPNQKNQTQKKNEPSPPNSPAHTR